MGRFQAPNGRIFLVSELCVGGSLENRLRQVPPLLPSQLLTLAQQVAEGMDYIHSKFNGLHCDLRAARILVRYQFAAASDVGLIPKNTVLWGRHCSCNASRTRRT
jgi:serine/threonine protein kinase